MKEKLIEFIKDNPGHKGRVIARELGLNKTEVNSLLYSSSEEFFQKEGGWHCINSKALVIDLPDIGWIDGESFDNSLPITEDVFDSALADVEVVFPQGGKVLLEAAARLLAFVNQLDAAGKFVTVDFRLTLDAFSYLDRIGFISLLAPRVQVLPERPEIPASDIYRDNSQSVVELDEICPSSPDTTIPKRLTERFLHHTGERYRQAAFTVFSELFGNVCEHSSTPIPGFAALQKYAGYGPHSPHIQIVVSDSGQGIVGTLEPVLSRYYPDVAGRYDLSSDQARAQLIREVLDKGSISQTGERARGLGLKRSQEYAVMYNADISVRQETFEVRLSYRDGELIGDSINSNLPRLHGTHVCFDFILDSKD
ncbi:hypothetical protein WNY58_09085 [Neptuniibacter pectenicola]|jgi:hypothetical protein|uniref:ATP-binding protein n=1 Tax=Neptuniibacter pectenicola TaxID=1806669 RepID=A0ABU9TS37_9GAMM